MSVHVSCLSLGLGEWLGEWLSLGLGEWLGEWLGYGKGGVLSTWTYVRFIPVSPTCVCLSDSAAGITVDDLVMQLVGLRYTEPDMTISYPGFLYPLMKLESMIRKRG